jgi:hypothetical protein
VLHAPPISFMIWSPKYYLARSINLEAPCNAVSVTPVTWSLLCPNIFLSTLFSNTLSLFLCYLHRAYCYN